jgi:hypothetical protein
MVEFPEIVRVGLAATLTEAVLLTTLVAVAAIRKRYVPAVREAGSVALIGEVVPAPDKSRSRLPSVLTSWTLNAFPVANVPVVENGNDTTEPAQELPAKAVVEIAVVACTLDLTTNWLLALPEMLAIRPWVIIRTRYVPAEVLFGIVALMERVPP